MKHENLYERGGVWWIRYNVNGEKVRRSLDTTSLREAKRLRSEILGVRERGNRVRETFGLAAAPTAGAPIPTFGEVADRFLSHLEASNVRDQTAKAVRGLIDNWARPAFGTRAIASITSADVVEFLGMLKRAAPKKNGARKLNGKAREGRKLHPNHRAGIFRALRRVFRWALAQRLYVGVNPCDMELSDPARPRGKDEERPVLTFDQAARLLAELEDADPQRDQLRRMATLALATGLRWGELCGLAWTDLDLEAGRLQVRRSYQGPPKNEAATAPIYLDADTAAQLRTWKAASASPWVFVSRRGEPFKRMSGADRERVREAARVALVADWERFTPHCCRHTFGSWEYERTGDAKYVQRVMRHARIETTLRVYVHDRREDAELVAGRRALAPTKRGLRAV